MNIVQLTTQDVTRALPVTTAIEVAEVYQVSPKSINDLITKYKEDFESIGKLQRFEIVPIGMQRSISCYQLTEDQFYLLVTYMKNTPIARKAKIQFVKAFSFAKKELLARQTTRHIGVTLRHSLTDSIKNNIADGTNFKKFAYSNYTKLVYKKVLGTDVKKSKELRGIRETDNLRDFLTIEELEKIQSFESKIAAFIEVSNTEGKDDKQIYQMVKDWIERNPIILLA